MLEVVNCSKIFPPEALVEADDLLALLLVVAKKFYIENALDYQFPLPGLTAAKQRLEVVDPGLNIFNLPASKVFWHDQHISMLDGTKLRRLNGEITSSEFGKEIKSA